ncbi:YqaA family protein [Congregibacter litoralis]|uniref:Putative membrane protein n=1 Tax=Congregibacter litoralis KT71 TaxID=314285 RepID=A4A784_9GAMM|nr:YqaA family protein [Congregibacter litoralis]EAQ98153.2 putative membrane protein [Congregibacter litoralis KT71]
MENYLLLFGSSFLAATILPFYSEIVLVLGLQQGADPVMLLLTATLGNTLGAVVNWGIGKQLLRFQSKRWFYFSDAQIARAQDWFQHRGVWSLLFAWLPIGGDALTLIAGVMNVRLPTFLVLVAIGKGLRYGFVLLIALYAI